MSNQQVEDLVSSSSSSTTEHVHTTIKGINFLNLWLLLLLWGFLGGFLCEKGQIINIWTKQTLIA
jgi:hypothetical protein